MFDKLQSYVGNDLSEYVTSEYSCFIIGGSPSKGAKSPLLWNTAFKALGIPCIMLPLDVEEKNLSLVLGCLSANKRVIGGCIAAPLKVDTSLLIGRDLHTPEALNIGAVNNIFKNSADSLSFSATNTDGEAALSEINSLVLNGGSSLENLKKVVILGTGGTGKAVVSYLVNNLPTRCAIEIYFHKNRNINNKKLGQNVSLLPWANLRQSLKYADLIVNCTSIGASPNDEATPFELEEIKSNFFEKGKVSIYDVNYIPSPSLLVQRAREIGINARDGIGMNFLQAVLAFKNSTKSFFGSFTVEEISKAMSK